LLINLPTPDHPKPEGTSMSDKPNLSSVSDDDLLEALHSRGYAAIAVGPSWLRSEVDDIRMRFKQQNYAAVSDEEITEAFSYTISHIQEMINRTASDIINETAWELMKEEKNDD
jgi:DNA-binding transcriptional MocR family regulator